MTKEKKLLLPEVKKLLDKAATEGLLSLTNEQLDQIETYYMKELVRWSVGRHYIKEEK